MSDQLPKLKKGQAFEYKGRFFGVLHHAQLAKMKDILPFNFTEAQLMQVLEQAQAIYDLSKETGQ